jgi:hypothetical protein
MATKPSKAEPANHKASRTEANRKRRLERTLKAQPNNTQVQLALKDTKTRRKAPIKRVWSHSARYMAQVFKQFCGTAPLALFSTNPKIQQEALQTVRLPETAKAVPGKVDFSIGARAHNYCGQLIWS